MKRMMLLAMLLAIGFVLAEVACAQEGLGGGMGRGGGTGGGGMGRGGGTGGGGMGQGPGGADMDQGSGQRLQQADTNGDGLISRDEWTGNAEVFVFMDADDDGYLDDGEIASARNKLRKRQRERTEEQGEDGPGDGVRNRNRERMEGAAMFAGELFNVIDSDNDGALSKSEISDFAQKIAAADKNSDGLVTREEARSTLRENVVRRIGQAFMEKHDTNKDGQVTREEFGGNNERFAWGDANSDGVITADDLRQRAAEDPEGGRGRGQGPGQGQGMGMGGGRGGGQGMGMGMGGGRGGGQGQGQGGGRGGGQGQGQGTGGGRGGGGRGGR